jgi:hypothetical protein
MNIFTEEWFKYEKQFFGGGSPGKSIIAKVMRLSNITIYDANTIYKSIFMFLQFGKIDEVIIDLDNMGYLKEFIANSNGVNDDRKN